MVCVYFYILYMHLRICAYTVCVCVHIAQVHMCSYYTSSHCIHTCVDCTRVHTVHSVYTCTHVHLYTSNLVLIDFIFCLYFLFFILFIIILNSTGASKVS